MMMGQWGPKHVGVCLLKHYRNYNEVCAFGDHTVTISQNVQNGKHQIRNYTVVVSNVEFGHHIDGKKICLNINVYYICILNNHNNIFRFLWPCIVSEVWRQKNQQDATIRCLLLTSVSTCFGHNYAHLQGNKGPVTAFGVYWSGFVGCGW